MKRIVTLAALFVAAGLSAPGPDPLIHASSLASYAHRRFEECAYQEALAWMDRAVDEVRRLRSGQPQERDTAGALLARLEIERDQLRRRRKLLDQAARQLDELLAAGWVQTVRSRLDELSAPACDVRFQGLEQRAVARAAQAAALVRTADGYLEQGQAGRALRLYQAARQLNRQHAGLEERIARARAMKPPGRAAAIVGTTLLTAVVVAGIGYAGYWIYRNQKQRAVNSAPAPPVRNIPPPVYRSLGGQR